MSNRTQHSNRRESIPDSVWRWQHHHPGGTFKSAASNDKIVVAVGDSGLIKTSSDGNQWTDRDSNQTRNIYGICYSEEQKLFVAVGYHGIVFTSGTGTRWKQRVDFNRDAPSLKDIAYGGGRFVAVGVKGAVKISTDGKRWRDGVNTPNKELNAIFYANGLFVAPSISGTVFTSPDGDSWKTKKIDSNNNNLYSVAYGNKTWVVGGAHGACFTSTDGIRWQPRNTGTDNYLMDLVYTGNEFIANGNSDGNPKWGSMILVSADGISWSREKAPSGLIPGNKPCFSTLTCNVQMKERVFAFGARMEIISKNIHNRVDSEPSQPPPPETIPTISIQSPMAGETWQVGSEVEIKWSAPLIKGHLKIEYSTDNGNTWKPLENDTRNDGVLNWRVPDDVSSSCRIKICDVDGPSQHTSKPFEIVPAAAAKILEVTAPAGGEEFLPGSVTEITWTSSHITNHVKIEYSIDNGLSWLPLDNDTKNDGFLEWTVPETVSKACIIRVLDKESPVSAVSSGIFSIVAPDFDTLSPLPGLNTLSRAVKKLKQGSVIDLKAGTYVQTEAIEVPAGVTDFSIIGRGMGVSTIQCKNCSGIVQTVTRVGRCQISGLTMLAAQFNDSQVYDAIRLKGSPRSMGSGIVIRDVEVLNGSENHTWKSGIHLTNVCDSVLENVRVYGTETLHGEGIHLNSCVSTELSGVKLSRLETGLYLGKAADSDIHGNTKHGCERITIMASEFSSMANGIMLDHGSREIVIRDCMMTDIGVYCIRERFSTGAGNHIISGGTFSLAANAPDNLHMIWLQNPGSLVNGLVVHGTGSKSNGLTISAQTSQGIKPVQHIRVSNCVFMGLTTGVYLHKGHECILTGNICREIVNGIFIGDSSTANRLTANIAPVTDKGKNNTIL